MDWVLNTKPYAVQLAALERTIDAKGNHRRGFLYLLEQGLGKTQVTLNEATVLHGKGLIDLLVVVCPNSLKGVWKAEAAKTGAPFKAKVWKGDELFLEKGDMVVVNYEAMRGRAGEWLTAQSRFFRIMLVADECIAIKSPKADQTRALHMLAARCHFVRGLTGAPITQGPQDLWGQLVFTQQWNGSFYGFRSRFCAMGGWMGKKVVGLREDRVEMFTKLIDDSGFRAKKEDWTDIPPLVQTERPIEMLPKQVKVYNQLVEDMFAALEDGTVSPQIILTRILRLQQVSSGFVTTDEGELKRLVEPGSNPKVKAVSDIMDEIDGKAIVFTQFRETAAILIEALKAYKPATLLGGQPDIDDHKARFEEDPECRVIVVQQQAGKYGHTLLGGGACSTTIFAENSWSLDTRLQALARNHRHGQRKTVVVHDITASPIDRAVLAAQNAKETSAEAMVDRFKAMRQTELKL